MGLSKAHGHNTHVHQAMASIGLYHGNASSLFHCIHALPEQHQEGCK